MEKILEQPPFRVIFLSLVQINSLDDRGIYHDLLRQFALHGHEVFIVCPVERRTGLRTQLIKQDKVQILQVSTFNVQKSNIWEKAVAMLSLNFILKKAVKKYFESISFDLILYATPPITLNNLITWLKHKNQALSYLLLKDIFPQNAIDMGLIKKGSYIHRYFKNKEIELYALSDRIGCMSPANKTYLIGHHPHHLNKVEVNPNSIEIRKELHKLKSKKEILNQLQLPEETHLYLYGGNLGKPQGTLLLTEIILKSEKLHPKAYFLIIGDGTDYELLNKWFLKTQPNNARLIKYLPKKEFDAIAEHCDVGLILLRKEFTIPNFPSRLLTYLENKMPVLAMTDTVSDLGPIAEQYDFGKWCVYGDVDSALMHIGFFEADENQRHLMGENGYGFLLDEYNVELSYQKIRNFVQSTH